VDFNEGFPVDEKSALHVTVHGSPHDREIIYSSFQDERGKRRAYVTLQRAHAHIPRARRADNRNRTWGKKKERERESERGREASWHRDTTGRVSRAEPPLPPPPRPFTFSDSTRNGPAPSVYPPSPHRRAGSCLPACLHPAPHSRAHMPADLG